MEREAEAPLRAAPHATPAERAALGKAARREAPRSGHAEFSPSPRRPDPLTVLEAQSADRVPELVPIRYARMTESPFRLLPGSGRADGRRSGRHPGVGDPGHSCAETPIC
ncbi:hypothetical protein GA0115255_125302 [Streptomyces sp. Ncost-T6T-2b]|nr:hypothetical protein GA0115255_125302 [Streptomyces sp. Ncost-T6T-2b]